MVSLVSTALLAPIVPAAKVQAAGGSLYEAESAVLVDAPVQSVTGSVYSGTGYVDLGDQANQSSITWSNVNAPLAGNYIVSVKYKNTEGGSKPFSLSVNGQIYTVFAGDQTAADGAWQTLTAAVLLNQGSNTLKVASVNVDGPLIDVVEVSPYATIFEAENGAGAAHSGATIGSNTGTAPGFSGTGYISVAPGAAGYLQYNNVVVPAAGKYTLKVRYSMGNTPRPYNLIVNGVQTAKSKSLGTGTWANWTFEEMTGITLNEGPNVIKIEPTLSAANTPLGTPVIDRLELVTEAPFQVGEQTFRTTTFESTDVNAVIAGTATDAALVSPLISGTALKPAAGSTVRIVSDTQSRWAEVTTPKYKQGIIGFPFHSSWLAPVPLSTYTVEATFKPKDEHANYIFKLVSAAGMESPIFAFGMDYNKIYARSNNTAGGGLAARADWSVGSAYKVKLVFHLDTKSYDMILNGTPIVTSEPLQDNAYTGGLRGFYMEVKDGAHQQTQMLLDDIQLSGSSRTGTAPVVQPNPGALFDEQPYIDDTFYNYYVSPTGVDTNNGKSADAPFKTLAKAASVTNPGDTVNLLPGTYSPVNDANDFLLINRSGAKNVKTGQEYYITYKAADPNNKPKLLLPPGVRGVWDMVDISANYIILDGLEIEGNNLNLTLAEAEAAYEHKIAGGSDWSRYALTNTNGVNINGHHVITRNNHVHHLSGGGIGGGGDYITVENNHIHSNSWYTFYATSGISFMNDWDIDNNTTDYKIIVRNNHVYDNETKVKWEKTKGYSDGNGIIFDVDDKYKGKKLVYNNIVYNNGGGGIHIYKSNNVHVINNTIYHNSRSPHLKYPNMDANAGNDNIFLNNISIARDEAGEYANGSGGWNNLFANNIYGGLTRFLGKNEKVMDPKFVEVTDTTYNFHLQPDSPAIDTGTRTLAPDVDYEGNARPYAGAGSHQRVDIGAYETAYNKANFLEDDAVVIVEPTPPTSKEATALKGTPVIDAEVDAKWAAAESFQPKYLSDVNKSAPEATVRLLWDENNIYVLAEVKDSGLNASGGNLWEHDSMEFFVDENNEKTTSYQADDRHYRVNYQNLKSGGTNVTPSLFTSAARTVEGGYIIEAQLPLTSITAAEGTVIGFDTGASDDSNADGIRDNSTMWSNRSMNSFASTQWFGNVTLKSAAPPVPVTVTGLTPASVTTTAGQAPVLPAIVSAAYSNGTTAELAVVWDAIAPSSYAGAGSFQVNGTVEGTTIKAVANVTVLAPPAPALPEDVSGRVSGVKDGVVNVYDLLFIIRNCNKTSASEDWASLQHADLNKDGIINMLDLRLIVKKIAGK